MNAEARSSYNESMDSESVDTSVNKSATVRIADLVTPDTRSPSEQLAARLRLSLRLFQDGVIMKRANLQRAFPDASPEEIQEKLSAWLLHRSHDQPGVRGTWPRQ